MKIKKAATNGNGCITHCKNTNNIRYRKTQAIKHLEKLADEAPRQIVDKQRDDQYKYHESNDQAGSYYIIANWKFCSDES